MFSDMNFSTKASNSFSKDCEHAPPLISVGLINQPQPQNQNNMTNGSMSKEDMKQLLIKSIIPEVASLLNIFASSILGHSNSSAGLKQSKLVFK